MKKYAAVILTVIMCLSVLPFTGNAFSKATLTLDPNGGSFTAGTIESYVGETVDLDGKLPKKDGMVFRGWAYSKEDADKGNIAFAADETLTVPGTATLYASYSYTVTLRPGPEGWGSAKTLYKYPDADLELCCSKSEIYNQYKMAPGKNTFTDQRVFIEWNTRYDSNTSRGTGDAYHGAYTKNENATLYAIWGFKIFYNADGGIFPSTGTGLYKTYVANYDGSNYKNPKTLYGNFGFPDGEHGVPAPVKQGCTLAYIKDNGYAFLLLTNSGATVNQNTRIFTTETASQNLTIPPTGGSMTWSQFHTTVDDNGDPAVEFYAAWQPSITYDANGGTGGRTDRLSIDYGNMYKYEPYVFKSAAQAGVSRSGYTFTGWNTDPNGNGISLPVGTVISQLSSSDSFTFYAQWKANETPVNVTITFNANGGTGGPTSLSGKSGEKINLGGSVPTRVGFEFLGWSTNALANTATYLPNNSYSFNSSVTLYAVWAVHENHDYQLISYDKETCAQPGTKTYVCTVCGQMNTETIPATGNHDWVAFGHPSTCGEYGETYFRCSVCDTVVGPIITDPTGEHDYAEYSSTPASCTENGSVTYKCSVCGDEYTDQVPALGHDSGTWTVTDEADCVNAGRESLICGRCGDVLNTREIPALGHSWGEWSVVIQPTTSSSGLKTRSCLRCDATEEQTIPVLTSGVDWSVEGYILVIRNANNINTIRLAPGVWTTSDEIRNAPGMLTYNTALIAANTDENGVLRIDLLHEGEFSMWVRYNDQTSYTISDIKVNPSGITPYISEINGITVKISDLSSDVYDIFIAGGHYTTYRECNDNKIVRLTETDLTDEAQTTNYGRTINYAIDYRNVSEDGRYTVCVRYKSERKAEISWFDIEYPTPEVLLNGLQITVTGLENIRNIRIAPGEYATASEVKRAEGVRIFSKNDRTLRDVADKGYRYTIQCRNDGPYTLSIEYIGGYAVVTTVNVKHLSPSVTLNADNSVTFGNLDGLYIIRYAPGVITAQSAFKSAEGNRYFRESDVTQDGTVTTDALSGVWSFMIQYTEESYNILSIDLSTGIITTIK